MAEAGEVTIKVTADTSEAERQIEGMQERLAELGRAVRPLRKAMLVGARIAALRMRIFALDFDHAVKRAPLVAEVERLERYREESARLDREGK